MARPLRLEFPGAIYHLTGRGNARQKVFFTDADRELFLNTLTGVVSRYHWICRAYCLMANHYHLLVETPKANLSIGMRQLNGNTSDPMSRSFPGRDRLTPRERDVLNQIASAASNKEAAKNLGISQRTVEIHRVHIMQKLGAKNTADLIRIVLTAVRSRRDYAAARSSSIIRFIASYGLLWRYFYLSTTA